MEANSVSRTPAVSLPRSRRLLAPLSDERLVEQVRRGNVSAFEAIYDRHHRGILGFCRHMLASVEEAEDAVQHTFIQAYDSIRRSERELKLKAWLYAIARNRCLSILRARREQAAELAEIPTAGLSEEVQQRAELRELLGDLRDLPEPQRAALVLSEMGDLSHADIATVVGCEVKQVKALVFQARSSLIETRNARATPCHEIREQLATATGGALRRGPLRRHLKHCERCSQFRDEVRAQRALLAAALPVVPSLALKKSALAAIGIGGGGTGAGGIAALAGMGAASKTLTALALAGATAAGGIAISQGGAGDTPRAKAAANPPSQSQAADPAGRNATVAAGHDGAVSAPGHARRHAAASHKRSGAATPRAPDRVHHHQPQHANGHGHHHGRAAPPAMTPSHGNSGNGHAHATPNGNAGTATGPPPGAGNDSPSGNNGNHNGTGNGHAYGHYGTPAQPPAKTEHAHSTVPAEDPAPQPDDGPKPDKPPKDKPEK
jgi:RNA polymerase sigma factor (sigma-70 family)